MKNIMLLSVLFIAAFASCTKKQAQTTVYGGCIQKITVDDPMNEPMSTEDSLYGISLMKKWWPHYDAVRLVRVVRISGGLYPATQLLVQQYFNGLPLLSDHIVLYFTNDSLSEVSEIWKTTTLDNVRSLPLDSIKAIYFEQIAKEPAFIRQQATEYRCLMAIAGYYDVNAGTGNDTVKIVKAWKVHPSERTDPVALIDDEGHLISFFNGVFY